MKYQMLNLIPDARPQNDSIVELQSINLFDQETSFHFQPALQLFDYSNPHSISDLKGDSSKTKLYLVPTTHGESYDPDFAPNPSPLIELPNIERWTLMYVVSVIEVMAGRRPIQQVARSTHRFIYNSLLREIGSINEVPKIRRIIRNQPIEGVVELTAILAFKNRVRALIARFEGVDKKWLCTELELL
ncbi:MAG: hypothetical protein FGM49_03635 [Candidatus Nanopelagicaceae bacterium]|nr:hypothetical protein [Candidatus Nanopelagicaceae bacterium]